MNSLPWYHKTTIYQIYPRSFYDSNTDGIGDLQGIIEKLDYVQRLGFETIWVSPFFSSPQADFGYDISDYTDIAPEYGTMADVTRLIEEVHRREMRIVFDMVMNHTSIEHPWFKESRSSRSNTKANWYIWKDKPNNWRSVLGGSGWHYDKQREQYFWATFLPFQPDLNYRNPEVKHAMLDIVRFWLNKGVDGFRLDIFNFIYKDAEFRDNPFSFRLIPGEDVASGFFQEAKYTVNQPENFAFAKEFRSVCDEFGERLSVGEVTGGTTVIRKFLGEEKNDGLTLVFDFGMLNVKFNAEYFRNLIRKMEKQYPHPFMPAYVFSNHDQHRSIHRLGEDVRKAKLLHLLQLTVRGVPCMYYGEEIGMTDSKFPFATALDPIPHNFRFIPRFVFDFLGMTINRDEVRTPMQWDNTMNAGFSTASSTWLPIHENHRQINVDTENTDDQSLLNTIRALLELRKKERALQEGSLEILENLPENTLGYTRSLDGQKLFILINFDESAKVLEMELLECIFRISGNGNASGERIQLDAYGGLILKRDT
jgi:glycosidase